MELCTKAAYTPQRPHVPYESPHATRQLDFVFASTDVAGQCRVSALNEPDDWGP